MKKPVITVVGSFAVGMTLRTTRMPIFGETLIGSDFDMGPGGKGSNQAVGSARMGGQSALVATIGDDKLGEIATDMYAREGVDTTFLRKSREMATGVGFIILNEVGENGIILDMSANKLMDPPYVERAEDRIAASDVVITVLEIPVAAAGHAMKLGRRHGVRTILNPAPAAPIDAGVFGDCDIVTPNESELRILLGLAPDDPAPTVELAGRLQARGAGTVIVTMGENGALVLEPGGTPLHVPGARVQVIDTTGAGDAFNAGLAVALGEGQELLEAVRFANCAGALACTALGVIPAMPHRVNVEKLLAAQYH